MIYLFDFGDIHMQVLYFKDLCPFSGDNSALNGLKSINWKNYGLALRSITNHDSLILDWESLPPNIDVNIAIHCYYKQIGISTPRQNIQFERNLIKKSFKLALDDMKKNYAGTLLSAHAHKVIYHVPSISIGQLSLQSASRVCE